MDWVIKVAHLICSPLRQRRVYTHTTGTSHDWYHQDIGIDWRLVAPGDQLRPGIYEFDSDFSIVLSQLSLRRSYSIPSMGTESSEKTLHRYLEIREGGRCGVIRAGGRSLKASHLIPKRMGTEGAKQVVAAFVGAEEALHAHQYLPMVGILLFGPLASEVD